MPTFQDFKLQPAMYAVLADMKITEPTPIQAEAIPALLAGNDFVGQSATGSGKTLAYSIPLVERIARDKRIVQALVLVPTRELAIQVHAVLGQLAKSRQLSMALLVGGRPYGNQLSALRYGAQIVVGTPGRVKDHLDRGSIVLSQLRMCVLDEADQMLDSGFAPDIEEILSTTPDTRLTALFSATIPDWIVRLQQKYLNNPVKVSISQPMGTQSSIEQIAYQVPQEQKIAALCTLLHSASGESSLIFGKTKHGVEKLGKQLSKLGFTVGTLHSNKSQRAREEVLTAFRRGQVQTLLATNIAARGLDITAIYQVINYELPESSDLFTHRVGRTGRMGRQGKAITLLVPSDVPKWRRMAHSLGHVVTLQRLAIDEQALAILSTLAAPSVRPEATQTREHEQIVEQRPQRPQSPQRPVQNYKPFSPDQERSRLERPKHDTYPSSSMTRRPKERVTNAAPAWQPEGFSMPARPSSNRMARTTQMTQMTDGRRGAEKQSSLDRTTGKRKAPSFATTLPQRPTARKKLSTAPVAQPRRASSSSRTSNQRNFSKHFS